MHQFTLRQLMWATALAAVYSFVLGLVIRHARADFGLILPATGTAVGGLIGLRRNNALGMLLGVCAGFMVTLVLFLLFCAPTVHS
jgi:hypothetical protein